MVSLAKESASQPQLSRPVMAQTLAVGIRTAPEFHQGAFLVQNCPGSASFCLRDTDASFMAAWKRQEAGNVC